MDCKKTKYATEAFALSDLERIKKNKVQREKVPIAVYLCKCGSWHLTSQPNWTIKISELEGVVKTLKEEKKALVAEITKLVEKNKALQDSIKKAEYKTVSSEPRVIMLNKTKRKAKELIRKLRKSNSTLISENIQLKKKIK